MRRFVLFLLAAAAFAGGATVFTDTLSAQAERTRPPATDERERERRYPAGSSQAQIAALREDVRGLTSMVREQNLVIEELQRRNRQLEQRVREQEQAVERALNAARSQAGGNFATMAQINRALEEMSENFRRASRDQRREIIEQVSRQIDELARETQRAMDALARDVSARPPERAAAPAAAPRSEFRDDFPEQGVSYTVQSGDTLSGIASRFNSTVDFIRNANRIENPDRLQVGQTLFIPQRD